MDKCTISKATLGRLPSYLEFLRNLPPDKVPYISATAIAKHLGLGEVQVRKDLAAVSGAGKPKLGYVTAELVEKLEDCLGCNQLTSAVLVGAGKLGRAPLREGVYCREWISVVAASLKNERAISLGSKTEILPINQFEYFCKTKNIKLGIITVGEGSAQAVCDQMVKSGITAIWNFAPCKLNVPAGILLQNENLALSLAHLNNQLCKSN